MFTVRIIARVKGILAADSLDFKLLKENKKFQHLVLSELNHMLQTAKE